MLNLNFCNTCVSKYEYDAKGNFDFCPNCVAGEIIIQLDDENKNKSETKAFVEFLLTPQNQ